MIKKTNKCIFCGGLIIGFGNNPAPVFSTGRACNYCDANVVIPMRIAIMVKARAKRIL